MPSLPHSARARSGAGRAARRDPGVHGAAVGEHRRDADHRVLEEAVPRARLARRAHRDQAAERRRQHDRRVVADRQAARRQDALELEAGQPGLGVDEQRVLVELQHLIEPRRRHVDARAVADRIAVGARRAAAGADRVHGRARGPRAADHVGDLGRRPGRDAEARLAGQLGDVIVADRARELGAERRGRRRDRGHALHGQAHLAGVHHAIGIEARLGGGEDRHRLAVLAGHVRRLQQADAVVMADRAADAGRRLEAVAPDRVVQALGLRQLGRVAGEREVDRAAVGVGVREVRHHDAVAADRGAHRVVEVEQAIPARRDLHRVDERAVAKHRRHPVAHRVPMAQPRPAGLLAAIAGADRLELGERQRGLDLGADARALEADDHAAAAARDLLGDRADQLVDELAAIERGAHRRRAQRARVR